VASINPEPGRQRRRWCLSAAASVALAGCGRLRLAPEERAPGAVVPFSAVHAPGRLPPGWLPQVPRPDLGLTRYRIVEFDGREVLHAVADDAASGLRCSVDVDPRRTPWLEWEWRTRSVDPRASVAVFDRDDAPARVAVGFDGDLATLSVREQVFGDLVYAITGYLMPFATLMYVWDAQAPPESVFQYGRSSRVRYLVVESGAGRTGRWLAYRRNVVEDYRRVFAGEPGHVRDVGVMTDSDDLKTRSESWYGSLSFAAS
jgi:hypothetical protein